MTKLGIKWIKFILVIGIIVPTIFLILDHVLNRDQEDIILYKRFSLNEFSIEFSNLEANSINTIPTFRTVYKDTTFSTYSLNANQGLKSATIFCAERLNNELWIGSLNGPLQVIKGNLMYTFAGSVKNKRDFFSINKIQNIDENGIVMTNLDGEIFLVYKNYCIKFREKNNKSIRLKASNTGPISINEIFQEIVYNHTHPLIFQRQTINLKNTMLDFLFAQNKNKTLEIGIKENENDNHLKLETVRNLILNSNEERNSIRWIHELNNGFYLASKKGKGLEIIKTRSNPISSLPCVNASNFIEADSIITYIAKNKYNSNESFLTEIVTSANNYSLKLHKRKSNINENLMLRDGNKILIYKDGIGLYEEELNKKAGRIHHLKASSSDFINMLALDRNTAVFSTNQGNVFRIFWQNDSLSIDTLFVGEMNTYAIEKYKDKGLFLALENLGIAYFPMNTKKTQLILPYSQTGFVNDLYFDTDNVMLYIASSTHGLISINQYGQIENYIDLQPELPNAVYKIIAIQDTFYLSSETGIYKLVRNSAGEFGEMSHFVEQSGLKTIDFMRDGAALLSNKRKIVWASSDEIYLHDLAHNGDSLKPKEINATAYAVNGIIQDYKTRRKPKIKWYEYLFLPKKDVYPIAFRADENNIKFFFNAGLNTFLDEIEYRYQLSSNSEHTDNEFSAWNSNATKELPNLNAGNYTLNVEARNFGGRQKVAFQLNFTVLPKWNETTSFIIVFLFIFLTIISTTFAVILIRSKSKFFRKIINKVFPAFVVKRILNNQEKNNLKIGTFVIKDAAVLFVDLVNFTSKTSQMEPDELIQYLDELYTMFDSICTKYQVEKIKTIGDAYMAYTHKTEANALYLKNLIDCAIEMIRATQALNKKRNLSDKLSFEARAGIAGGDIIGGMLGSERVMFDVWGEAVNKAARLESIAMANEVCIERKIKKLEIQKEWFKPYTHQNEEAVLKGFDEKVPLIRLRLDLIA